VFWEYGIVLFTVPVLVTRTGKNVDEGFEVRVFGIRTGVRVRSLFVLVIVLYSPTQREESAVRVASSEYDSTK
jgi:hypothetical protein